MSKLKRDFTKSYIVEWTVLGIVALMGSTSAFLATYTSRTVTRLVLSFSCSFHSYLSSAFILSSLLCWHVLYGQSLWLLRQWEKLPHFLQATLTPFFTAPSLFSLSCSFSCLLFDYPHMFHSCPPPVLHLFLHNLPCLFHLASASSDHFASCPSMWLFPSCLPHHLL